MIVFRGAYACLDRRELRTVLYALNLANTELRDKISNADILEREELEKVLCKIELMKNNLESLIL